MRVLITGGSGTFGRAFTHHLLDGDRVPDKVVIYSRGEHAQETMEREFAGHRHRGALRFLIGDVRDRDRLELAMRSIDHVVHAAALKIVPRCEADPSEAVKTNVVGADNVIHAAIRTGVFRVVALSTDKAVAPVNLYGATKLAAEKLFIAANAYNGPRFAVVRYGNVSGSQGSVIPLWRTIRTQLPGSPLPVTDPDATRFWLNVGDACKAVSWLLQNMRGGELLVPKMRAYTVRDLLEAMDLKGALTVYTGLRAGEKLHETIISEDERNAFAEYPHGYVGGTRFNDDYGQAVPAALTSQNAPRIPVAELRQMVEAI